MLLQKVTVGGLKIGTTAPYSKHNAKICKEGLGSKEMEYVVCTSFIEIYGL